MAGPVIGHADADQPAVKRHGAAPHQIGPGIIVLRIGESGFTCFYYGLQDRLTQTLL
ncbi:hypothetical protein D3C85_1884760 [compost metagenome]